VKLQFDLCVEEMSRRLRSMFIAILLGVGALAPMTALASEAELWTRLQQGDLVLLLRHTETVAGVGDPPGFKLDDCATQRNLSAAGRSQARAWSEAIRKHTVPIGGVFSSQWCRTVETAKLAFGTADTWPALNSHFDNPQTASLQAAAVRGGIPARMHAGKNLVLVTHQVNIFALTGRTPTMGEAVLATVERAKSSGEPVSLRAIGMLKLPY